MIDAARRMDREALVAMRICGDPLKADQAVGNVGSREVLLELTDFELERDNGHRSLDSNLENKLLMDALTLAIKGQLTTNQHHAIVRCFAEGFSLLETARIVGKAAGSVKVTQNRAIAKLRKVLDLR